MTEQSFLSEVQTLDQQSRLHTEEAAVAVGHAAGRQTVLKLLNDVLAAELISSLRYPQHHHLTRGLHDRRLAEQLLSHAHAEQHCIQRIARRIVQLGGTADFSAASLVNRNQDDYVQADSLAETLAEDLIAGRVAVASHRFIIDYLGDEDPTTREMLEDVVAIAELHAKKIAMLLRDLPRTRPRQAPSLAMSR